MDTLSIEKFYHSIMAGAYEVLQQKNALNEINVFPVADGDTGTNLASMMQTILEQGKEAETLDDTMNSIADAALIGARGNSGIIFAQYINGMLMHLKKTPITTKNFAYAVSSAVPYAYSAISNPVEGTMITVMREWAEEVDKLKNTINNFIELLSKAFEVAKTSLRETPNKLQVLKDASVVDAGAKGFVHFIDGFLSFLQTGERISYEKVDTVESHVKLEHNSDRVEKYRYCTEALIETTPNNTQSLKDILDKMGDSLVLAGNERKTRIHIHTDKPADVFYQLRQHSTIIDQKVDDMKKQYEAVHERKYKTAIVTDSIADIPKDFVDEYQVFMYPLNLVIEDSNYFDKLTITSENFYKMMDTLKTYPSSSQPNQKALENYFSFLTSYYDEIIVLTVSEKMSGTHNVFKKVVEQYQNTPTKITLIDSKQNSGAQGLLVQKAALAVANGTSYEATIKMLENTIKNTKILVSVKTLKYMVRSGRVSKVTGVIGKILNLKPVISIDETGEGIIFDKALSVRSNTKKIMKHITKVANTSGIESYSIVHAKDLDRANEYQKQCEAIIGKKPDFVTDISSIVAMSAGIGSVAISYIKKDVQ